MHDFAELYRALDETTSTNAKVQAMADYFAGAPAGDAAWAVYFLSGRRPKRLIRSATLREWVREEAGLPEWLLQECYDAVGDTAETVALLLPEAGTGDGDRAPLAAWMQEVVLPLRTLPEDGQRQRVIEAWRSLDGHQRFVFNKLLTGGFRVGVSQKLLVRGLEAASGVDRRALAHRLMGHWEPTPEFFIGLLDPDASDAHRSRPYPFCLAHAIDSEAVPALGPIAEWVAEWKWDGIRAQLIRRRGSTYLWSRGEELITDRYPEVEEAARLLPDGTVLDGELLAFDEEVLPFAQLQRRIGRKRVGKKLLQEVPVVFLAFDLLEWQGDDLREAPLAERRRLLEAAIPAPAGALRLSELVEASDWEALAERRAASRERLVEGLMLKRRDSVYHVGRVTGDWWKWKVAPFTIDAVLLYAQRGSGRRASLYTDYTFAVRDGDELVPVAKAYSGLTDAEIREVDRWVRRNTRERFGPVRSVPPELVFEIAFEGIQRSKRHKSGIAVRFPRIARWRRDKTAADIDRLADVERLIVEPA
jgi:DNA ligase 1